MENKTPSVVTLVTTATLNTQTKEIEDKKPDTTGSTITTEFNRSAKINFDERMKQEAKILARKVK